MNRHELAEVKLKAPVFQSRSVHIEDYKDDLASLAERIRSGQSTLRVTAYPWGVEFDVLEVGEES
jgi:hypothetical protein